MLRTIRALKIIFELVFYYRVEFITLYVIIVFRDMFVLIIFKSLSNFTVSVK